MKVASAPLINGQPAPPVLNAATVSTNASAAAKSTGGTKD